MALVTCPECDKQISSTANACPSCGFVQKKRSIVPPGIRLVVGLIVMLLIAFVFWWVASIFIFKSGLIVPEWTIFAISIALIFGAIVLAVSKRR